MCDYSLMEFPNRLATDGEMLVIYQFPSGSLGLASPLEFRSPPQKGFWSTVKAKLFLPPAPKTTAVCIPPGARLILHDVPTEVQQALRVGAEEEVKFVQMSAEENRHRDAVRFRNGYILRLQELTAGQRVTVIDLGDSAIEEPEFSGSWDTIPIAGAQ